MKQVQDKGKKQKDKQQRKENKKTEEQETKRRIPVKEERIKGAGGEKGKQKI